MTKGFLKIVIVLLSCGIGLVAASCEQNFEYRQSNDEPITAEQNAVSCCVDLSDADVVRLTKAALAGDNDAALNLSSHYDDVGDHQSSRKWLELAANRGSCAGISLLIMELENENASSQVIANWRRKYEALKCRSRKVQYKIRE